MKRISACASDALPSLGALISVVFLCLSPPLAVAQDTEPNDPCTSAQDLGAVTLPFVQVGELGPEPDLDFFRIERVPGDTVRVDLEGEPTGAGTLGDPLLGLFDSDCNVLAHDDDGGEGLNSRLVVTVPADGVYVLAVTSFPDFSFSEGALGTYRLTLASFEANVSIGGEVSDAVTGASLPGDSEPFAFVSLFRCDDSDCSVFVNDGPADSMGRYRFNADFSGDPLEAGTYQIEAFANEYQRGQSEPFAVSDGEDRTVNIALEPFPIGILPIESCGDLPPEGGTCAYRVRLTNRSAEAFGGAAWSVVFGGGIGSLAGFTQFQTALPQPVALQPGASKVLRFDFHVPSNVSDGAFICADLYVGRTKSRPSFRTVAHRPLFCIEKGSAEFSVMPEGEAQGLFRQLRSRALMRRKGK